MSIIKQFFYRIFCGFLLGVSIFAPGFSGSFLAIVMGVYHDLLRIISNPFKQLKQNIIFCLPMGIGAVISAVLFVIAFKFLFETYEKATYLLFVGLIAGNLPVIFTEVKEIGFQKRYLIGGAVAFAAALLLGLSAVGIDQAPSAAGITSSLPYLSLCGFAAGVVALVPGMSVSMFLLILGVYSQIIFAAESLLHMNFIYISHLSIFLICAVIGLVLTSRGIKMIFKKFPGFANSMVFGFMVGSLIGILAKCLRIGDANFNWLLGGIMLAAGLCVSMLFLLMGKAMKKP